MGLNSSVDHYSREQITLRLILDRGWGWRGGGVEVAGVVGVVLIQVSISTQRSRSRHAWLILDGGGVGS